MTSSDPDARANFGAKVQRLVGRRILTVDYWDIHHFSSAPAHWDYDDWHHAVMGVQLSTDGGPVTVTWTSFVECSTRASARLEKRGVPPDHIRSEKVE